MALDKNILQVCKDEIATKFMICSFAGCSGENKRHAAQSSNNNSVETCMIAQGRLGHNIHNPPDSMALRGRASSRYPSQSDTAVSVVCADVGKMTLK
jgi:hypothetical protein